MKRMVVGFGGQQTAMPAIRWGREVAASSGTPLTVASAVKAPGESTSPDEYVDAVRARRDAIEGVLRETGPIDAEVDIEVGDPLDALVEMSESRDASIVVVSKDEQAEAEDVGGFGVRLLRNAHRAVAVIPGEFEHPTGGTFVVGVDGSDANTAALALAESLARAVKGSIKAVFAYDEIDDTYTHAEGWHRRSDAVRDEVGKVTSVPIDLLMEAGPADMVLLDVAEREHAAAIIVGTRGRMSLGGHVLGHVPVELMHTSRWPVIAVPH